MRVLKRGGGGALITIPAAAGRAGSSSSSSSLSSSAAAGAEAGAAAPSVEELEVLERLKKMRPAKVKEMLAGAGVAADRIASCKDRAKLAALAIEHGLSHLDCSVQAMNRRQQQRSEALADLAKVGQQPQPQQQPQQQREEGKLRKSAAAEVPGVPVEATASAKVAATVADGGDDGDHFDDSVQGDEAKGAAPFASPPLPMTGLLGTVLTLTPDTPLEHSLTAYTEEKKAGGDTVSSTTPGHAAATTGHLTEEFKESTAGSTVGAGGSAESQERLLGRTRGLRVEVPRLDFAALALLTPSPSSESQPLSYEGDEAEEGPQAATGAAAHQQPFREDPSQQHPTPEGHSTTGANGGGAAPPPPPPVSSSPGPLAPPSDGCLRVLEGYGISASDLPSASDVANVAGGKELGELKIENRSLKCSPRPDVPLHRPLLSKTLGGGGMSAAGEMVRDSMNESFEEYQDDFDDY